MKLPENFIFNMHFVEKCPIWDVLTNLSENVPFLGSYLTSKHFSYVPLSLSRQGALLITQVTIFSTKTVGRGSKLKNIVTIVLITHFISRVHTLIF